MLCGQDNAWKYRWRDKNVLTSLSNIHHKMPPSLLVFTLYCEWHRKRACPGISISPHWKPSTSQLLFIKKSVKKITTVRTNPHIEFRDERMQKSVKQSCAMGKTDGRASRRQYKRGGSITPPPGSISFHMALEMHWPLEFITAWITFVIDRRKGIGKGGCLY